MKRFSIFGLMVLACVVAYGVGDPSNNGDLAGYRAYQYLEVYRPAPSATANNVTRRQCAKNCSEQAERECKHFQYCEAQGLQRGVCQLYAGDNIRLRTRPSDDCTIYTNDDPAELGIPHGASLHNGVSSHVAGTIHLLVLLPIIVATSTFWRASV